VDFEEAARELGFHPRRQHSAGAGGARMLEAQPNPFMTYVVQVYPDGTALFTWEFALGEYLAGRGIQMGSDETLNQFIYPRTDVRGPQDAAWLAATIERTEDMLSAIRLDRPEVTEPG
jgi:hypothetical protein